MMDVSPAALRLRVGHLLSTASMEPPSVTSRPRENRLAVTMAAPETTILVPFPAENTALELVPEVWIEPPMKVTLDPVVARTPAVVPQRLLTSSLLEAPLTLT